MYLTRNLTFAYQYGHIVCNVHFKTLYYSKRHFSSVTGHYLMIYTVVNCVLRLALW